MNHYLFSWKIKTILVVLSSSALSFNPFNEFSVILFEAFSGSFTFLLTNSTTLSILVPSHTPSLASTINASVGVIVCVVISGSEVTPSLVATESPIDRVTTRLEKNGVTLTNFIKVTLGMVMIL